MCVSSVAPVRQLLGEREVKYHLCQFNIEFVELPRRGGDSLASLRGENLAGNGKWGNSKRVQNLFPVL